MIQTSSAPQNDCLNLSFVKDFCIVGTKMARNGDKMARNGDKMARNGDKMAIYQMQILLINL